MYVIHTCNTYICIVCSALLRRGVGQRGVGQSEWDQKESVCTPVRQSLYTPFICTWGLVDTLATT